MYVYSLLLDKRNTIENMLCDMEMLFKTSIEGNIEERKTKQEKIYNNLRKADKGKHECESMNPTRKTTKTTQQGYLKDAVLRAR